VGDLPLTRIPVRVGVVGTPLLVQRERVLLPGLHPDGKASTSLPFGVLPAGAPQQRTFWVGTSWQRWRLPACSMPPPACLLCGSA
jgi:hypothetical protein